MSADEARDHTESGPCGKEQRVASSAQSGSQIDPSLVLHQREPMRHAVVDAMSAGRVKVGPNRSEPESTDQEDDQEDLEQDRSS